MGTDVSVPERLPLAQGLRYVAGQRLGAGSQMAFSVLVELLFAEHRCTYMT